nr:PREDICTED: kunitz-type serine protease inhibitor LmKTT-1c-like [Anolis carolinensis]|eukprot:XP_008123660.1 PREDICTED: kunitz-type serine protease inhibitor LmKTT-1c-like [Anolis carolinensis]
MMQAGSLVFSILIVGVFLTLCSDLLGIPGQAEGGTSSKQPAKCQLPADAGTGNKKLNVYYYNIKTKKCLSFVYRGSGGNENRFLRKKDCVTTCQQ